LLQSSGRTGRGREVGKGEDREHGLEHILFFFQGDELVDGGHGNHVQDDHPTGAVEEVLFLDGVDGISGYDNAFLGKSACPDRSLNLGAQFQAVVGPRPQESPGDQGAFGHSENQPAFVFAKALKDFRFQAHQRWGFQVSQDRQDFFLAQRNG